MLPISSATPAFGAANLSNCEREPIHLAGGIQPHGALLTVHERDLTILQASANAAAFLRAPEIATGMALEGLGGDLWKRTRECRRLLARARNRDGSGARDARRRSLEAHA